MIQLYRIMYLVRIDFYIFTKTIDISIFHHFEAKFWIA